MAASFIESHKSETFKSMITISLEAFKYLALLNSGAAVWLLTFVKDLRNASGGMPDVRSAITWFMASSVLAGLCFLGSYITQVCLHNENLGDMSRDRHKIPMFGTLLLYIAALLVFANAVYQAAQLLYC